MKKIKVSEKWENCFWNLKRMCKIVEESYKDFTSMVFFFQKLTKHYFFGNIASLAYNYVYSYNSLKIFQNVKKLLKSLEDTVLLKSEFVKRTLKMGGRIFVYKMKNNVENCSNTIKT